jgi:hypothetical protein
MKAYFEDLRKKIVEALEKRGMPKIKAAKTFGVGISPVKRYVASTRAAGLSRRGGTPAPNRRWTRPPGGCSWRPTSRSARRPRCLRGASSLSGWPAYG